MLLVLSNMQLCGKRTMDIKKFLNRKKEDEKEEENKPEVEYKPFIPRNNLWDKLRTEVADRIGSDYIPPLEEKPEQPLLILKRNNGFDQIIEGVDAGEFRIQTPEGEKSILLHTQHLWSIPYGTEHIKFWVAYEDSAMPYPHTPLQTARAMNEMVTSLAMNYKNRDEARKINAQSKMYFNIIIAVALGLVLLTAVGFWPAVKNAIFGAATGPSIHVP